MLTQRILDLENKYGGLRQAARVLKIDAAYLLRLKNGEKKNPSDKILKKLGLIKINIYVDSKSCNKTKTKNPQRR